MNPFDYYDDVDYDYDFYASDFNPNYSHPKRGLVVRPKTRKSLYPQSKYNDGSYGYWQTKSDGMIKISNMTDSHLENSINLMKKHNKFTTKYYELTSEQTDRKMKREIREKLNCLSEMMINRHLIDVISNYVM
jgi:hypothetical protein